jgi:hypothetical protein
MWKEAPVQYFYVGKRRRSKEEEVKRRRREKEKIRTH